MPFATTWKDLEAIMLSEISQTLKDKSCMIALMVKSKKAKLIETETRVLVSRGWVWGKLEDVLEVYKFPVVSKSWRYNVQPGTTVKIPYCIFESYRESRS